MPGRAATLSALYAPRASSVSILATVPPGNARTTKPYCAATIMAAPSSDAVPALRSVASDIAGVIDGRTCRFPKARRSAYPIALSTVAFGDAVGVCAPCPV
jgi:hypothetical protein